MKALFIEPSLQEQFDLNGYVVVTLLSEDQIQRLLQLYSETIQPTDVTKLYESSRHNAYEKNKKISNAIYEELEPSAHTLFSDSTLYGGTFMVKSGVDSDVLPLHQDWSVVDEEQYNTLFIWCPLMDVSVSNGGLFVLDGSHRYFRTLRSGSYPSNRYILPLELHQFVKDIPLKAGQAILYSDRLFHGSHANNSVQDRIVITGRVVEKDGRLVYLHKVNETEVGVYEADEKFYLTHIDQLAKGQLPPAASVLYRYPYRHQPITESDLETEIANHFSPPSPVMNASLFRDTTLQKEFDQNGFVIIDFIQESQVAELKSFYKRLTNTQDTGYGFHVSLDNQDPAYVEQVSEKLIQTVQDNVAGYFTNHQIFTASFVVKEPNPLGFVPPHQDWTFVDERHYWSATIWCPLIDIDEHNGGLALIKGSHRFYNHIRPSPSPQYEPPFKAQIAAIFPYLKYIDLKAGQAIVFDNRTLHASPPNTTNQPRVAFGIGITHEQAQLRHYFVLPRPDQPILEGFDVDPTFFLRYNNARLAALYASGGKPGDLNSIGVVKYTHLHYETAELIDKMVAVGNTINPKLHKIATSLNGEQRTNENGVTTVGQSGSQSNVKLPFWKVYTPMNIVREVIYRMTRK
jgi:ectoine hydroxylase-related dioxygenase (phytanoyl-CoA dioxygenase family)